MPSARVPSHRIPTKVANADNRLHEPGSLPNHESPRVWRSPELEAWNPELGIATPYNALSSELQPPNALSSEFLIHNFVLSSDAKYKKKCAQEHAVCGNLRPRRLVAGLRLCRRGPERVKAGLALFLCLLRRPAGVCHTCHPYAALDDPDISPAKLSAGRPPASVTTSQWLRRGQAE